VDKMKKIEQVKDLILEHAEMFGAKNNDEFQKTLS
jgi:hypothetical protein